MLAKNLILISRDWHCFRRPLLEALQLSGPDLTILAFLEHHKTLNQDCMCTSLLLDKATMAKSAARLEERGYIQRTVNALDKREKLLEMTPAGLEACAALHEAKARWESICLEGFSPQERELFSVLCERAARNAVDYRKKKGDH